ncbi:MAG: F0F1 ATP synthase subunit A [Eubacteriales bacterium]|nr:F0F1 ATP synthase subunit A [Eubacteriales bacterium]
MEISITGAKIYFTIPIFGGIPITATIINAWLVMVLITGLCIWLTRGMQTHAKTKRQHIAEWIVETVTNWVTDNMGERYSRTSFTSFIAALFALSIFSSLLGLFGLYPPTADLSTTAGWSVMVFVMITYTKIRTNKVSGYLKGLTEPVPLLTPLNIISELSTPLSMAFRHFGNIASGQVVGALIYAALLSLNHLIFGWLPGAAGKVLSTIPFTQVGIPGVLSLYFDLFSAFMQAFIFCMLTMNYISAAAETE